MFRLISVLVALLFLPACEFDARSDLTCTDGDTRPGQECINGFWVDVGDANNANNTNNVNDMSMDMPATDMGMDMAADMPDDMEMCVPESDMDFCARQAFNCGMATANDNWA